ncbi:selenocysteine-specific translation elongation factor [Yinghuangia seranimata]|uniref:selenocysteine-specific translation elongation factor n=1 Tax=Yinghuangia seranimata TaxID=408067 RepID=UPI00248BB930|nr:selenocysteine-specific translation elongation factor [Yinghuangia seranimata]MDI2131059.1 selenocysteine-specific translation elongation factor [Yinghuangia seranimata]
MTPCTWWRGHWARPDMHVIATAGHVDHGKSTLLRALTGMEPDRWAEERRRGMTIDLGYVWTTLPSGAVAAFVDVPGHQRFFGNALAGFGPVPAVLLVVAADEGWCRQTSEHVAALRALDVRHGVVAITRSDLGDAELASEEAALHLAGTPLADAEHVAVSGVTGEGLPELRDALDRLARRLPAPDLVRPARLWVDRVFTVRGAGTVVTGTLGGGTLAAGDELVLVPSGRPVGIRGLESLKTTVDRADAVARVAVNLRGVGRDEVRRGDALIAPGGWHSTAELDVRLHDLRPTDEARRRALPEQLTLHIGSAAVPVRTRTLGGSDTARLTLATPLPVAHGERVALHDPGRRSVVAGADVIDAAPPRLSGRRARAARALVLEGVARRPDPAGEVVRRGAVRRELLLALDILSADDADPATVVSAAGWLVDPARWDAWREALLAAVDTRAAAHPLAPGLPGEAAARDLGLPDVKLLDALVAETRLVSDGWGVHRPGVAATLPERAERALRQVEAALRATPFTAPSAAELDAAGLTTRELSVAVAAGRLLRVGGDVYLLPSAAELAAAELSLLAEPFTLSQAREALGTTRRVAVPLMEHLDRVGVTRRVSPELRVLRAVQARRRPGPGDHGGGGLRQDRRGGPEPPR